MKEYVIHYTVNGKGFDKDLPWIYDTAATPEDARQAHEDAVDWLRHSQEPVVWVEAREVGPWTRVDVDSLA